MTNTEIIKRGQAAGKTSEEISADLAVAGYKGNLNRVRSGNAYIVLDDSNHEPITVADGKIADGTQTDEMYTIVYEGEDWHVADDHVTLVPGPGIPDIQQREVKPDDIDRSRHIELANTSRIQKTKKGTYETFYDANGYAYKHVRL